MTVIHDTTAPEGLAWLWQAGDEHGRITAQGRCATRADAAAALAEHVEPEPADDRIARYRAEMQTILNTISDADIGWAIEHDYHPSDLMNLNGQSVCEVCIGDTLEPAPYYDRIEGGALVFEHCGATWRMEER